MPTPSLTELNQVGKLTDWSDVVSEIEVLGVVFTSIVPKGRRPLEVELNLQAKVPKPSPHSGVPEGQDASGFSYAARKTWKTYAQKCWDKPGISDWADEVAIAAVKSGEWQFQLKAAAETVKRMIEKRCLSNNDLQRQAGPSTANETRGQFSWTQATAQSTEPVPEDCRPESAQRYSGTLTDFEEDNLGDMVQAAYEARKGPAKLEGFVGIRLKRKIGGFTRWDITHDGKANVRRFEQSADEKALTNVIDRLVMDGAEINLHTVPFLYTTAATGEDTDYTHRSGLFLDMDTVELAFVQAAKFRQLEDQGGGKRGILDVKFASCNLMPRHNCSAVISAD